MTVRMIDKKAEVFRTLYGSNLRVRAFPAYTANPSDIRAELEDLEYSEGFIPDVIVVDYKFTSITNAQNYVVKITATFIVKASGAFLRNGFGFNLPDANPDLQANLNVTG